MRPFIALCLVASNVCLAQTDSAPVSTHGQISRPSAGGTPIATPQRDAVHRAAQDYLEGFYEGDTAKLVRSLHRDMFKYGFWKAKDSPSYTGEKMSYDEAIKYARDFKANKRTTPATAPREITIFEVQDQTASAKVRAWWGTDYLLLGKYDGKWMISHILWQGP